MVLRLPDVALLELRSLVVERIAPEAPKGMHDDMAMALALCYRALRDIPHTQVSRRKLNMMDKFLKMRRARQIKSNPYPWKIQS